MSGIASVSKTIVIRTSRDTLGLVVAATAVTFALAYAVHSKQDVQANIQASIQARQDVVASAAAPAGFVAQDATPEEDWTGHLVEVTSAPTPAEPMTSASLTVPKAQLALPMVPKALAAKPRPCVEPQPCALKALAPASSPPARRQANAAEKAPASRPPKSLVGLLNPLNHLPDMSMVGRPFTYAGGAVTGWFKRL